MVVDPPGVPRAATHAPPSHRRRPSAVRVTGAILLIGLLAAVVIVGALSWRSLSTTDVTVAEPSPARIEAAIASDPPDDGMLRAPETTPSAPEAASSRPEDLPTMTLVDVAPAEGSSIGGEAVVLTGTGFAEPLAVTVGGRPAARVQVLNDRKLRVLLPPGLPGDAVVEITRPSEPPLVVEGLLTYVDRPPRVVMAIRPALGSSAGGTAVTIVGTGFEPGARVVIGGERATSVEVVDATRITAITAEHDEGIVDVVVRNPGMPAAVLEQAYEFVPGPTLTGVDPIELANTGGVAFTVWGTGFVPGIVVSVNGLPASEVQVIDGTVLTAVAPIGVPGPASLRVEVPGQPPATLLDAFVYVGPPPAPQPTVDPLSGDPAAVPAADEVDPAAG